VGVSLDTNRSALERMVAAKGIGWAQLFDGKTGNEELLKLFNVRGTPTLYLLDGRGNIFAKRRSASGVGDLIARLMGD